MVKLYIMPPGLSIQRLYFLPMFFYFYSNFFEKISTNLIFVHSKTVPILFFCTILVGCVDFVFHNLYQFCIYLKILVFSDVFIVLPAHVVGFSQSARLFSAALRKNGYFFQLPVDWKWYVSAERLWAAAVFLCLERVSASGFRFAKRETSYNTSYNNEGINSALPLAARDHKKQWRGTLFWESRARGHRGLFGRGVFFV